MKHFPDNTLLLERTRIVRERLLPPGIRGEVLVKEGDEVNATDTVVWGTQPSDYVIIDVADALDVHPDDSETLADLISVEVGEQIDTGTPLAHNKKRGYRRYIPKAPARALVTLIEHGRVILQVNPKTIQVQARLSGRVASVEEGRGVVIEAWGALLQGAWGNGQFSAAPYAFEPGMSKEDRRNNYARLSDLLGEDVTLSPYRGKVIVLMRPLTEMDMLVVQDQELAGLVAPCAPVDLREKAMGLKVPVILTEGFGLLPPTQRLYDLLIERRGGYGMFDAAIPDTRINQRPEIIIASTTSREAPDPVTTQTIQPGMQVRLRRAPYAGKIGKITQLPDLPVQLENGLRVPCAQVELRPGERVMVPLANLESLGEPVPVK